MKLGQFFSRPVFRATVFALALLAPARCFAMDISSLLAAISAASSLEEAREAYINSVDKLSEDARESKGVKQDLIDSVKKQAESNVRNDGSGSTQANAVGQQDDVADLKKEAEDAKAKEQSTANKMLGGLTMAATGIGGMQLMQGMAEKKADEAAAADMAAYLGTVKCGISGGMQNIGYNEPGHTPPETRELADARLEYTVIARKMKTAKENLGMPPGIEDDLIIDTSKGLYDNAGTDTDGISHHFDTGTERAESGAGKKRMIIGGVVAGAGVVGGVVGNAVINKKDDGKKKDEKSGGLLDGLSGGAGNALGSVTGGLSNIVGGSN
ncbi:MAG: hypothetical protein LBL21_03125 [Rickettsiales bacterium]|jgi:hypothetical protein|nr:hypothetical protein [Rickettsiales bacterium]